MLLKSLFLLFCLHIATISSSQDLVRYSCLLDRVDADSFKKAYTLNNEGIVKTPKGYNGLVISQIGIFGYYKYLETGDSTYYQDCVNQYKYFQDTSLIDVLPNNKGIGIPYNYDYSSMKSPWYSGMTQGYALSYLLRYYKLTGDKSSLEVMKKVAYFMLLPQSEGGTISQSKDGCTWIEEYPNSKNSKQVLNGYMNGLIGLKEYCDFFPKDTDANQLLKETYDCFLSSLENYDTSTWTYYNRSKKKISNLYLRYQIYELDQLFEMFGDSILLDQRKIWSVMSHKNYFKKKSAFHYNQKHDISLLAEIDENGMRSCSADSSWFLTSDSIDSYEVFSSVKKMKKVIFKGKKHKPKKKKSVILNNSVKDSVMYSIVYFNAEVPADLEINLLKTSTHDSALTPIKFEYEIYNNLIAISHQKMEANTIVIEFNEGLASNVTSIDYYNSADDLPPFYGFYYADNEELKRAQKYTVSASSIGTNDLTIFYKYATEEEMLKKEKWKTANQVSNGEIFTAKVDGYYSFMIVFDWNSPLSSVGDLVVTPK